MISAKKLARILRMSEFNIRACLYSRQLIGGRIGVSISEHYMDN